jgi:hypothetical protein
MAAVSGDERTLASRVEETLMVWAPKGRRSRENQGGGLLFPESKAGLMSAADSAVGLTMTNFASWIA